MAVADEGTADARALRALGRVLRALVRSGSVQRVLDEVVESSARLCLASNGRLYVLRHGLLHPVANYGAREGYEYEVEHPIAPDRGTMTGRVVLTRTIVNVADVEADREYTYAGPRHYRSALSVPILLDDELIGVIGIVRETVGAFTDEQVEVVQTFADQAAVAIANARLLETVERQRSELARFLSPQVAELITSDEGERLLVGHRAYISVLFCDLRGFTAFAETAEPEELLQVLREYHATIGGLIRKYQGTLEHFAGDGLMVFFNDPVPIDEHELRAVSLALEARDEIARLASAWRKRGIELGLGIGIAAGYATLGRIGFDGRYDYGALGRVTNLAARLSTRAASGEILIGPAIFAAVEERVDAVSVGELQLKGFGRPVAVHNVVGPRGG
jgi:class 3 adenylate cyclase